MNNIFSSFDIITLVICSAIFYWLTVQFKLLVPKASLTACIFGIIIYLAGEWRWLLIMLFFFTTSSMLSRVGTNLKHRYKFIFAKSSSRDHMQVLANGSAAIVFCIFEIVSGNNLNFILYLSSIAAVNSDTWATEIGTLSKNNPRYILNLKPVEKGSSGAVSLLGLIASLAGSFSVVLLGASLSGFTLSSFEILLLGVSGSIASIVDSLLGASFQAQYFDDQSQTQTERVFNQSGNLNKLIKGFSFINNDSVNLLASFSAPLFYLLISHYLA